MSNEEWILLSKSLINHHRRGMSSLTSFASQSTHFFSTETEHVWISSRSAHIFKAKFFTVLGFKMSVEFRPCVKHDNSRNVISKGSIDPKFNRRLASAKYSSGMKGYNRLMCGGHLWKALSCFSRMAWIVSQYCFGGMMQTADLWTLLKILLVLTSDEVEIVWSAFGPIVLISTRY